MSERDEYGPGEFCWVELVSPDVDAAAKLYGDLLDWERERYKPDPEGYRYFRRDGKLVAGLNSTGSTARFLRRRARPAAGAPKSRPRLP
jgi:uncharacterized protein